MGRCAKRDVNDSFKYKESPLRRATLIGVVDLEQQKPEFFVSHDLKYPETAAWQLCWIRRISTQSKVDKLEIAELSNVRQASLKSRILRK